MSENEQGAAVQRQMLFIEDGGMEPEEGPVGTSLEDFGADVDHRERERRVERVWRRRSARGERYRER